METLLQRCFLFYGLDYFLSSSKILVINSALILFLSGPDTIRPQFQLPCTLPVICLFSNPRGLGKIGWNMAFELILFKARTLEADVLKIGKPFGWNEFFVPSFGAKMSQVLSTFLIPGYLQACMVLYSNMQGTFLNWINGTFFFPFELESLKHYQEWHSCHLLPFIFFLYM